MKRFYQNAATGEGGSILLDGRPVRTPARHPLVLPTAALARAVADEWQAQGDDIDPRSMPMTGFANAAIDRIAPDIEGFCLPLAGYAETDLLCYRADGQPQLADQQTAEWDPILDWAAERYGVDFTVVTGIMHQSQPDATIATLASALKECDPFRLAAMSPLITISGSLVIALAVLDRSMDAEVAFDKAHLDELWQIELWGEDYFATQLREAHRRDFLAAARLLDLLD
jgi:chaperone required for assembly of F1-ATPase